MALNFKPVSDILLIIKRKLPDVAKSLYRFFLPIVKPALNVLFVLVMGPFIALFLLIDFVYHKFGGKKHSLFFVEWKKGEEKINPKNAEEPEEDITEEEPPAEQVQGEAITKEEVTGEKTEEKRQ